MTKLRVATHEAGHIIAHLVYGVPLLYGAVMHNGSEWQGIVLGFRTRTMNSPGSKDVINEKISINVAGMVAEEMFFGPIRWPRLDDEKWTSAKDFDNAMNEALKINPNMIQAYGYVLAGIEYTRQMLAPYRTQIEAVAKELEAIDILSSEEINAICKGIDFER